MIGRDGKLGVLVPIVQILGWNEFSTCVALKKFVDNLPKQRRICFREPKNLLRPQTVEIPEMIHYLFFVFISRHISIHAAFFMVLRHRGDSLSSLGLTVVGLGDRGVGLVAARCIHVFALEVDSRRRLQIGFESPCSVQWCWTWQTQVGVRILRQVS